MNKWGTFWNVTKRRFGMQQEDKVETEQVVCSDRMRIAMQEWFKIFYNQPAWAGENLKLTKFGAIVAGHVATLTASEIRISAGVGARAEFVKKQANQFIRQGLYESLQLAAVGGMVAVKPCIQGRDIYCDVVKAGDFQPLRFEGKQAVDAVFIDHAVVNGKTLIRLEKHEFLGNSVRITNRVFTQNVLRKQGEVSLDCVPQWADLPVEIIVENVDRPLFTVIKMPFANTVDPSSDLPVSIYANAVDTLREIDRVYNEFLWELKSGRRKQIIDITAAKIKNAEDIRNGKDPQITTSDQFLMLDFGNASLAPFSDYTPEMRITSYQTALNIQLRLLESQCGLSAETFSFDLRSGEAKTATEVLSNDRNTYNTVKAIQESGLHSAMLDLLAIFDIYASLYSLAPNGKISAGVEFGDSVFEDTGVEYARRKEMADSGYLKKEDLLAWYFGVSIEEAKNMLPKVNDGV